VHAVSELMANVNVEKSCKSEVTAIATLYVAMIIHNYTNDVGSLLIIIVYE
jgi:hypothetical protein